jgi:hypothetical protein
MVQTRRRKQKARKKAANAERRESKARSKAAKK